MLQQEKPLGDKNIDKGDHCCAYGLTWPNPA